MNTNFKILENTSKTLYNSVLKIEENIGLTFPNFSVDMRRVIEGYIQNKFPITKSMKQLGDKISHLESEQSVSNEVIIQLRATNKVLRSDVHYQDQPNLPNYSERIKSLKTLFNLINDYEKDMEFNENYYKNQEINLFNDGTVAAKYFNNFKSNFSNKNEPPVKYEDVFTAFCAYHLMESDDNSYLTKVYSNVTKNGINQFFFDDYNNSIKIGKSFYDNKIDKNQFEDAIEQIKKTIQIFVEKNDYYMNEEFLILKEKFYDQIENCDSIDIYIFSMTKSREINVDTENTIMNLKEILKPLNDDLYVQIHIIGYNEIISHFEELENNNGILNQELILVDKDSIIEIPDVGFYMCVIQGRSLKKLYDINKELLFEKNVRGYIKNKKIDNEISSTISTRPDDFLILNNGITIVAKNVVHDGTVIKFKEMFIVNGAQTTSLIGKSEDKLNKLRVLAKIIEVKDESNWDTLTTKISEASNNQKPIKPLDLLSNDKFIRKFANILIDKKSIWRLLYKRSDKTNKDIKNNNLKKVELQEVIKIYLAFILQLPGTARNKFGPFLNSNTSLILKIFKKWDLTDDDNYDFFQDIMLLNDFYNESVKKFKDTIKNSTNTRDRNIYDSFANGRYAALAFVGTIVMHNHINSSPSFKLDTIKSWHTKIKFSSFIEKDEFGNVTVDVFEKIYNLFLEFADILSKKIQDTSTSATNNLKSDEFYLTNLQRYIVDNFGAQGKLDKIEEIAVSVFTNLKFK
jgi:hypothetical protein